MKAEVEIEDGEVGMNDEPNKITATLKVVVTGEFYDDEASEETLRYYVEQYLEDAGFDADVALLKEQEPVKVKDYADIVDGIQVGYCPKCDRKIVWNPEKEETVAFCKYCGQKVKWG